MLYSYCIPVDDGAAPNPFWETCTLAICKPGIRRHAKAGDWVVGTGSVKYGFQNQVVYAMRVDDSMSFEKYDEYCQKSLPEKIPDWNSHDLRRKTGDCIYDFSTGEPVLRPGVHEGQDIIDRDLSGRNVLLSKHFYYFGAEPVSLPQHLLPIVLQGQSYRSALNEPYEQQFIVWIETFVILRNKVNALPYGFGNWNEPGCNIRCSERHISEHDEDMRVGEC